MSGTKILWGQISIVFLIVLVSVWSGTQWVAFRLGFQPQLGPAWFEVAGWPVYCPPALFWWWYFYEAYAPRIFAEGGIIAASGGWNPNIQLTTHLGGKPVWNDRLQAFLPGSLPPGMALAGAVGGNITLDKALASGINTGSAAATESGHNAVVVPVPQAAAESDAITPLWRVAEPDDKAFVDQQNDVTEKDIELAEREGQRILEEARERFELLGCACVHRTGHLKVGEPAVWVGALSGHRDGAFQACRYVIDEVKSRVPIWKREHYLTGSSDWIHPEA